MLFLKSAELSKTTYSIWGQSRKFNDIIYIHNSNYFFCDMLDFLSASAST